MKENDDRQREQERNDPPRVVADERGETRKRRYMLIMASRLGGAQTLARTFIKTPLRQFPARGQRANDLELWSTEMASSTLAGSRMMPVPPAASMVASTSAAIPAKPRRPPMNSSTAISFAALSTVGAPLPDCNAWRASASAGNRTGSGASKVRFDICAKIEARGAASMRVRPGEAVGDRHPHVGRTELGDQRAVADTRRCRGRPTADGRGRRSASERKREQMMRLDELEALVHHGRGIDRDLGAHRPVGMAQRLLQASRRAICLERSRCGTARRRR